MSIDVVDLRDFYGHQLGVVMRHQDVGELPAGAPQGGFHRRRLRRVDRRGRTTLWVVNEHAVIVLQAAEQFGFSRHMSPS